MTLLGVQQVLSRVLTDPDFRDSFFTDPFTAAGAYELTPREVASLALLHEERVRAYARLLANGRAVFALDAFPSAATLLRPVKLQLADRLTREFPPVPTELPRQQPEAARLAALVGRLVAAGELGPPYLSDVVVFELAVFQLFSSQAAWTSAEEILGLRRGQPESPSPDDVLASVPVTGEHVAVRSFDHDVVDLADRLKAGEIPESPTRRPTLILMARTVAPSAVARQRVNTASRELLDLCDGRRTAHEVVDELADRLGVAPAGRARFARSAVAALCRLRSAGAVGLRFPARDRPAAEAKTVADHQDSRPPVGAPIMAGRREGG